MPAIATPHYDHFFQMLVVGDSSVGKSCLMLRFADGTFTSSYVSTIGVDFKLKTVDVDKKVVKLQLWDTAGQERFRCITRDYYRRANAIMLTFDVTERSSFDHVRRWNEEIRTHFPDGIPTLLVGNKVDEAERKVVRREEAQELAQGLGLEYIETSAKTGENVEAAFLNLVNRMLKEAPAIQHPSKDGASAGANGGKTLDGKQGAAASSGSSCAC